MCVSLSLSLRSASWLPCRFTIGYSCFTLNLKLKDFGVNVYLRRAIPAMLVIPTQLCCIFLLEQIGRKWSLAVTLFQTSFLSLLILTFPPGTAHPPQGCSPGLPACSRPAQLPAHPGSQPPAPTAPRPRRGQAPSARALPSPVWGAPGGHGVQGTRPHAGGRVGSLLLSDPSPHRTWC